MTVDDTTEEQEDVEPEEAVETEQQSKPQPQAFAHPLSNLPPELDVRPLAPTNLEAQLRTVPSGFVRRDGEFEGAELAGGGCRCGMRRAWRRTSTSLSAAT